MASAWIPPTSWKTCECSPILKSTRRGLPCFPCASTVAACCKVRPHVKRVDEPHDLPKPLTLSLSLSLTHTHTHTHIHTCVCVCMYSRRPKLPLGPLLLPRPETAPSPPHVRGLRLYVVFLLLLGHVLFLFFCCCGCSFAAGAKKHARLNVIRTSLRICKRFNQVPTTSPPAQ